MSEIKAEEPGTALITAEKINAPALFGDGNLDEMMAFIRDQCKDVLDVVPDLSTKKSRQAIKGAAYKVTRSKTLLDDAGKEYAAELKERVKAIDGNRRTLRESLDALRDEIRKPVDDWEAAEEARIANIERNINRLISAGQFTGTSEEVGMKLATVKAVEITEEDFGERQGDGAIQKDVAVSNLERALAAAQKRESDERELEELRRKEEKRAQEDREREREAAAKEQAEGQERARVEKAEKDAQEAIERAEQAEQEAAERVQQAEKEAEERIEAERKAREDRDAKERKRAEERAADTEHRRKVNRQAVAMLVEWAMIDEETAKSIVTVIAAGRITGVKIEY